MSEPITFIGDVHGRVDAYWKLLHKLPGRTVQLGDFGFRRQHQWHLGHVESPRHRVLFGNHDDTKFLGAAHSMGHWKLEDGVFYIRGAHSIDYRNRTVGVDLWEDEELSYAQGKELLERYMTLDQTPRVVASHECPQTVAELLFGCTLKTRTGQLLQHLWLYRPPALWVFGHHHRDVDVVLAGTRFICLNELSHHTLDQ